MLRPLIRFIQDISFFKALDSSFSAEDVLFDTHEEELRFRSFIDQFFKHKRIRFSLSNYILNEFKMIG